MCDVDYTTLYCALVSVDGTESHCVQSLGECATLQLALTMLYDIRMYSLLRCRTRTLYTHNVVISAAEGGVCFWTEPSEERLGAREVGVLDCANTAAFKHHKAPRYQAVAYNEWMVKRD